MADFSSLEDLANHLAMAVVPNVPAAMREGLDEVGKTVVAVAKTKFGIYQRGVYKYPKWAPLSEYTIKHGNPNNAPLLRSGADKDSINYFINNDDVVVGSSEPDMVYHEVGTKTEPPRPVLGPALYETRNVIREILGKATVLAIVPGSNLTKAVGFKRIGPRITSERYNEYRGE